MADLPSRPLHVRTIEILWHCNERNDEAELLGMQSSAAEGITSIDYHPTAHRIVTTGGDGNLRLWALRVERLDAWLHNGASEMADSCQHLCRMRSSWMPLTARWSPHGAMIASAHCDGKICLWWRDESGSAALEMALDDREADVAAVEEWKDYRHLTGHIADVYDLCFSADSRYLFSGAGDGSIVIHDVLGSTMPVVQLTDLHTKFCRGVAWDPWMRYLHSFGSGPALLCFTHVPKSGSHRRMHLAGQRRCQGEFIGESCALSSRRMSWSPDGLLLAVPYGKVGKNSAKQPSTGSLFASIDAKLNAAQQAGSPPDQKKNSLPAFLSPNSNEKSKHWEVVDGGHCQDEELEALAEREFTHCINIYTRAAPEKVACRLGIRGYNEIRGVLWAPCFLEPLRSSSGDRATATPLETTAGARAASTAAEAKGSPPSSPAAEETNEEEENGMAAAEEAVRRRRGAWGPADYHMALAAWTSDAVIVYTTDSETRHSDFTDLHMRSITDVAWSSDASYLYTASLDGYVSVISFGDTLSVAHRLPSFSPHSSTLSLCRLLQKMQTAGTEVEAGRCSRAEVKGSLSDRKDGSDRPSAAPAVVVVRKKKKVDGAGQAAVSLQQLEALLSGV